MCTSDVSRASAACQRDSYRTGHKPRPREPQEHSCLAGLVFWTRNELVDALGAVAPDYEACKALVRRLASGSVALHSAAVLLPELFAGGDPGLAQTCLDVPDGDGDSRHAWVMGLPWQEQGHKAMVEEIRRGSRGQKASRKRKGPRDGDEGTPAQASRRTRKGQAGEEAGAAEEAALGGADATPVRRLRARSRALAAELAASKGDLQPDGATVTLSPERDAVQGSPQQAGTDLHGDVQPAAGPNSSGAVLEPDLPVRTMAQAACSNTMARAVSGSPSLAGGTQGVGSPPVLPGHVASPGHCQASGSSQPRRARRRGLMDPAFAVDVSGSAAARAPAVAPAGSPEAAVVPGVVHRVPESRATKCPALKATQSQALEKPSLLERLRAGLESDSD